MKLKILLLVSSIIMIGCSTLTVIKPADLKYEYIQEKLSNPIVGYRITSNSLEYDVEVVSRYLQMPMTFEIYMVDRETGRKEKNSKWKFLKGKKFLKSSMKIDEEEYLNLITDLQLSKGIPKWGDSYNLNYPNRFLLSSSELHGLVDLAKNKKRENSRAIKLKRKKIHEQEQKLITNVSKTTRLKPALPKGNQVEFDELVNLFKENGISRYKNKFVWLTDGFYKISQVFNDKVILTSYNTNLPPITILTSLDAIEGQLWSKISRAPLKIIGISNYTTVLGASKQTIVLKQL